MDEILSDSDGDVPTLSEPTESSRLLGLIAAMKDEMVICFDYQGLKVEREGGSMYVSNPETGNQLGGRLVLESADLRETEEWLEAKADCYGVEG